MNAVVIAVVVMLGLSLARVHVVLSLLLGALAGGLMGGLGLGKTMEVFQTGLANGAQIALSYAMLGAFAVAIAHSGLPQTLANAVIRRLDVSHARDNVPGGISWVKWGLLLALLAMSIMSQNLIPIHIAFIPLIIPPLLLVFNRMKIDRRLLACLMTFGLVTTYMWLPYGFGEIFLKQILLGNINKAGLDTSGVNVISAMTIPALGMVAGLLIAFISYRKKRVYDLGKIEQVEQVAVQYNPLTLLVAGLAIASAFIIQLWLDSMIIGALAGFLIFSVSGIVRWRDTDDLFTEGMKMMAMIGFIMIAASLLLVTMDRGAGEISTAFSLNQSFADILTGIILFFIIGCEFFITYRLQFRKKAEKEEQ